MLKIVSKCVCVCMCEFYVCYVMCAVLCSVLDHCVRPFMKDLNEFAASAAKESLMSTSVGSWDPSAESAGYVSESLLSRISENDTEGQQ